MYKTLSSTALLASIYLASSDAGVANAIRIENLVKVPANEFAQTESEKKKFLAETHSHSYSKAECDNLIKQNVPDLPKPCEQFITIPRPPKVIPQPPKVLKMEPARLVEQPSQPQAPDQP